MSKVMIGSRLAHSDHKAIEFKISVHKRKSARKTSALEMRRADFRLLGELASPLRKLLKVLGSISAYHFLSTTS